MKNRLLIISLVLTSIVGAIGIPIGDPKFVVPALALESIFVVMSIISFKKSNLVTIPSMIVAIVVIVGNTISPQHIKIMTALTPLGNAVVLFFGGYVLQGLVLYSGIRSLHERIRQKI